MIQVFSCEVVWGQGLKHVVGCLFYSFIDSIASVIAHKSRIKSSDLAEIGIFNQLSRLEKTLKLLKCFLSEQ